MPTSSVLIQDQLHAFMTACSVPNGLAFLNLSIVRSTSVVVMGMHDQQDFLPRIQRSHLQASKLLTQSRDSKLRRFHHHVTDKLPEDVLKLKQKILESHPIKLTRFSLTHFRRVTTPPVDIPDALNNEFAVKSLVSGKTVPLTLSMWKHGKSMMKHLDMIDERVSYQ
ncbi:hypothetical protein CCR75_008996 [Bremia lactucae]|uniref:Uncharacterized protein n=1 Tax=Bremia lactucae TaxID=4779 RepID=A0A976FRM5_BRELC|nr:hypothetical protein CCR75_008996 [Bremia lactucae]